MARVVSRNNVFAGSFLVLALLLAVGVSFALGDRSGLGKTVEYTVRFSLRSGATGLKPGSDVRLGGQMVGKVTSVAFARENVAAGDDQVVGIDVGIKVRRDIALFPGTGVTLEQPLLGTLTTINIWSVGDPRGGPTIAPGSVIPGGLAPPSLITQLGLGAEDIQKIPELLENASQIVKTWRATSDQSAPKITAAVDDVGLSVRKVRDRIDDYLAAGDRVAKNAEDFSSRLGPWMDEADAAVARATAFTDKLNQMADENRPGIRNIVDAAEETVRSIRDDSLARLNAALDNARNAMSEFQGFSSDARTVLATETPNVQKTLANLRLASDQLKLTMTEVRAQPWRLLQRPTTKELERELLYDAARAYVVAASDLRATADAIAGLEDRSRSVPASELSDEINQLKARLQEGFSRYERTEAEFLDRLIQQQDAVITPEPDPRSSSGARR